MKTAILICMCWICLSCMTVQHESGARIDVNKLDQIIDGKTTEQEVLALLGEPQNVTITPYGGKIYMYRYIRTAIYGRPYLSDSRGKTETQMVMIRVNKDGTVTKQLQSLGSSPSKTFVGQTLQVPKD